MVSPGRSNIACCKLEIRVETISLNCITVSTEFNEDRSSREKRQPSFYVYFNSHLTSTKFFPI